MNLYLENGTFWGELNIGGEPEALLADLSKKEMKISNKGLELIKEFEGFKSNPYLCPAGVPTIGYGTTRYSNGNKVTMNDKTISKETASNILRYQVNTVYGDAVNDYTTIMNNQKHFDALTSFTYNLGVGNLKSSTLLKKHNKGDFDSAANEFLKWVYADGELLKGLVNRRDKERELYLS